LIITVPAIWNVPAASKTYSFPAVLAALIAAWIAEVWSLPVLVIVVPYCVQEPEDGPPGMPTFCQYGLPQPLVA
jgi:hypothetical protein